MERGCLIGRRALTVINGLFASVQLDDLVSLNGTGPEPEFCFRRFDRFELPV